MNMTVTESDRKLLSFLAAFLLAVLFIIFVFRPLMGKNRALEKEIKEAEKMQSNLEASAILAEDMTAAEQSLKNQIGQMVQRFYPMLQSQEAGNMVTILMLNHGFKIQNLSIIMPEKASTLKWYQYSRKAIPVLPEEEQEEEEEDFASGVEEFGVYAAKVTCIAEGKREDMMELVDDISANYPAISILSAEWATVERPVVQTQYTTTEVEYDEDGQPIAPAETPVTVMETTGSLTLTLEIYMCTQ